MIACTANTCIPAVDKREQGQRDMTLITATNHNMPPPINFVLFAAVQSQVSQYL
jgi:hypothetical protein